jgi:transposase
MDNQSGQKGRKISELIEAQGCEMLFLPPYSPELNPRVPSTT